MKKYRFNDSTLDMKERVADLLSRLTIDEKASMLSSHMAAVPRLGIKEWYVGSEVARGYVSRNPDEPTTVFPQPIGLSGTFDTELMQQLGLVAGKEARVMNKRHPEGHLMLWGPTVDMCRNPLWGRNEEGYGEDPYLTGEMSAAYTRGLADRQGEYYQTIPTLKHFCANNTEKHRGSSSSNVDMRTLNEYYYAAFEPA
ncbi:MAG: glycoside hydrolase family 3 protein, partial [Ruminiclostridium sp.]|nr:glycoside hydrolase family 3 protein [Ruminiclostridium sp.]